MHLPTRLLGATFASLVLIVGCSGTPDSNVTPTATLTHSSTADPSTASASASPTVSVRPPALPEAATHNDEAGQLAFIEYWWDLYNYAYATGDPGPLMAVSDSSEASNAAIQRDVERGSSEGRYVEGGRYRVVGTVRVPVDNYGVTAPTVTLQRDAGFVVTKGAREPFKAGEREDIGMVLVWERDHWQMNGRGTL